MFPFTNPKNQFLGSLMPSSSMKTSTPATSTPTGLSASPVTTSSPAATGPVPPPITTPTTTTTTAKSKFIESTVSPRETQTSPNVSTPSGAIVNKDTGSLVSGPPAPSPEDTYKNAFEQYIKTLTPSNEETAASSFLNSLLLQQKKDQEEALGRGETLGFAAGEAARVNKNNAFQIDAASNALNAITARRSSTADAEKARVDFMKSMLPSKDPFSLSPGEVRYDAKGNVIASRPANPKEPKNKQIIGTEKSGYFTVNEDGTVSPVKISGQPSWEEYIKAAQERMGMNLLPNSEAYKKLKSQFDSSTKIQTSSDNDYDL